MTRHCRDLAALPADTAALGQQLLPESNPYRIIGDHLADLLDDAPFADLYEPTGRAALSPALMALVTLFQFVENIPDREAAEQYVGSGEVSGPQLAQSAAAGIDLGGPPLADTSPNAFTIADFAIDRNARRALCRVCHKFVPMHAHIGRAG